MDYILENKVKRYLELHFDGDQNNAGEVLLENIELNGREFLEIAEGYLENLRNEKNEQDKENYENLEQKYKELEEIHKELIKNLENIIKDKEGSTIDKIREILEEEQ